MQKKGKREKKIKRKEEGAACSPIRCFCLFVMLEHSSEQGFVGWGGCCLLPPSCSYPQAHGRSWPWGLFFLQKRCSSPRSAASGCLFSDPDDVPVREPFRPALPRAPVKSLERGEHTSLPFHPPPPHVCDPDAASLPGECSTSGSRRCVACEHFYL